MYYSRYTGNKLEEKFDVYQSATDIALLPVSYRLVYAAGICERLYPNYAAFCAETGSCDADRIRVILDDVWNSLKANEIYREEIDQYKQACEALAPDTEDFSTPLVSSALDVCSAIYILLDCMLENASPESLAQINGVSVDTVDMFIQSIESYEPSAMPIKSFDKNILQHPLMQRELSKQRADIEVLSKQETLSIEYIEEFRKKSLFEGKSNIGY